MAKKRTDANGMYLTRRDQIEAEDLPACMEAATRGAMRKLLLRVAYVGACGERDRTLEILRRHGLHKVADAICSKSVLEVLGY